MVSIYAGARVCETMSIIHVLFFGDSEEYMSMGSTNIHSESSWMTRRVSSPGEPDLVERDCERNGELFARWPQSESRVHPP